MNLAAVRAAARPPAPVTPVPAEPAPVIPLPVAAAPTPEPVVRRGPVPESWSRLAGRITTTVAVYGFAGVIEQPTEKYPRGLVPIEPGDGEISDCEQGIAGALRYKWQDGNVPWWMGMALGLGNLYCSMRLGAKPPGEASAEVRREFQPPQTQWEATREAIAKQPPVQEIRRPAPPVPRAPMVAMPPAPAPVQDEGAWTPPKPPRSTGIVETQLPPETE